MSSPMATIQSLGRALMLPIAVLPVGVLTAVYLHEYAPAESRSAALIRVAITNLAGVPSIVFGLFGLGFFIQFIGGGLDKLKGGELKYGQPGLLWAALTLAVLTLPVVIVASRAGSLTEPAGKPTRAAATPASRIRMTLLHPTAASSSRQPRMQPE